MAWITAAPRIKEFLRSQAYDSRLARLLTTRASRLGAPVFMFHHTLPGGSTCFDAGMDTEPALFEGLIVWLKERFNVVSVATIAARLAAHESIDGLCALTIDDGWRDTYAHAFPILRRHGVAASVYVPLDYIGTERQFWQDAFWDLHRQLEEQRTWAEFNRAASSKHSWWPRVPRRQTFAATFERIAERPIDEAHALIRWGANQFGVSSQLSTPAFMTWDQVREMRDHGITFGSHTNSHALLTRLPAERAHAEVTSSKKRLEEMLGSTVSEFCYPSGDHDGRVAEWVRQAGYAAAVTVEPRLVTRRDSAWTIPRVGISSSSLRSHGIFSPSAIEFQLARAGLRARLRKH
jgi:peptidoglycan/xylan/chitin deacetylase (PgdA/CDA1 family)